MQYPNIFFRDSFAHGALAKSIKSNGYVPNDMQYAQYPGAFIISAVFSEISGIPILEANMMLAEFLNLLFTYLLFALGKVFVGPKAGWLIPMIYFAFSFRHYTGLLWYSPQLVGLCLYALGALFIYETMKIRFHEKRSLTIVGILLLATLTITHPFSVLMTLAGVLCVYIFGVRIKWRVHLGNEKLISFTFVLLGLALLISWHIFVASETLGSTLSSFLSLAKGVGLTGIEVLYKPPIGRFTPLLEIYRYGVYIFFGILSVSCLVIFRQKREVKLTSLLLIGAIFSSAFIYFTPATYGVSRILFFAGILISILSSYAILANTRGSIRKLTRIFMRAIPFFVIATFIVSILSVSIYTWFIHPNDVAAAEFAVSKIKKPISVILDDALVIGYIANEPLQMRIISDRSLPDVAKIKFEKEDMSLQNLPRQLYYYNFSFVEKDDNLIYSNGFSRIYSRINNAVP
jgi:hypothetical protein